MGDARGRGVGYVGLSHDEAAAVGLPRASSSSSSPRAGQAASTPADPAQPMAWIPVVATNDAFPLGQGPTYRVTASVSKNFTKQQVSDYLTGHGWTGVTLFDELASDAAPADWPGPETLGTLEDNHRWLRGQATHTGAPTAIDVVSTLHAIFAIHLSIYRIANVWQQMALLAGMPSEIIGPSSGLLGLDPSIDAIDAATVYGAWKSDSNPDSVADLARTMRANALPIAADLLDQRALELEGQQQTTQKAAATGRNAAGIAAGVASLLIGVLGALRRH